MAHDRKIGGRRPAVPARGLFPPGPGQHPAAGLAAHLRRPPGAIPERFRRERFRWQDRFRRERLWCQDRFRWRERPAQQRPGRWALVRGDGTPPLAARPDPAVRRLAGTHACPRATGKPAARLPARGGHPQRKRPHRQPATVWRGPEPGP